MTESVPDNSMLHSLGPYFIGTIITAAFGAFAGAWASSRRETKRAVIAELNSVSAARMLAFSICNKYLSLKKQIVLPNYTEYQQSREAFVRTREAFLRGEQVPISEFRADLRTVSPIWLPAQSLERQIFEKISIRGRALAGAVDLIGAIDAVDETITHRNELIAEIKSQSPIPPLQLALRYYGLRGTEAVIDQRFQANMDAIYKQTDDCIFFSRILADDLFDYGTRLRGRHAWKYRLGVPKLVRENWKLDTSINGLLLAGSRVFGGLWLPIFAWSELASAEWLALGI